MIINLHLSGTCIKDTDLFQRDITELLNHPIGPIYNLAKQFAKLLLVSSTRSGPKANSARSPPNSTRFTAVKTP